MVAAELCVGRGCRNRQCPVPAHEKLSLGKEKSTQAKNSAMGCWDNTERRVPWEQSWDTLFELYHTLSAGTISYLYCA